MAKSPNESAIPMLSIARFRLRIRSELRIPALQLKREWSPWPEFGSDPGNPRELGWCRPRKLPAEILAYARAAYPQRRSSNANSLQSQNSAGFPQICATFQRDNLRRRL